LRCHAPAPPVAALKGAGAVWPDRPWLVAPNLTADVETGIGRWTDDMLLRAIREGIGHDGRVPAIAHAHSTPVAADLHRSGAAPIRSAGTIGPKHSGP
jgi:hypothetical protein